MLPSFFMAPVSWRTQIPIVILIVRHDVQACCHDGGVRMRTHVVISVASQLARIFAWRLRRTIRACSHDVGFVIRA